MHSLRPCLLLATLLAPGLSGCIAFSGLDPASNYQDIGNASIIVMGVSPRYRIHVSTGATESDGWHNTGGIVTLNAFPEDGYIVARLAPRSGVLNYGISGILPEGMGSGGNHYIPCPGRRTFTFDAPAGAVVFVGDVSYAPPSVGKLQFGAAFDIERARAHLRTRFPLLADRLVDGSGMIQTQVNGRC